MNAIKNKLTFLITFILFICFSYLLPAKSQTIDLNINQDLAISAGGIYIFSLSANNQLKTILPTSPSLILQFTSFSGAPLKVAPVGDFNIIGTSQTVTTTGNITVDFSMALQNTGSYGLSLTPSSSASVFSFTVVPQSASSSTPTIGSTSTSSSSGGSTSSSSSSGGIVPGMPGITILGPDKIFLESKGNNLVKFTTSAFYFPTTSRCQVFTSNDPLLKVKPRSFSLNNEKNQKVIDVKVPTTFARNLITTGTSKIVTINVTCKNGARNQIDLLVIP